MNPLIEIVIATIVGLLAILGGFAQGLKRMDVAGGLCVMLWSYCIFGAWLVFTIFKVIEIFI